MNRSVVIKFWTKIKISRRKIISGDRFSSQIPTRAISRWIDRLSSSFEQKFPIGNPHYSSQKDSSTRKRSSTRLRYCSMSSVCSIYIRSGSFLGFTSVSRALSTGRNAWILQAHYELPEWTHAQKTTSIVIHLQSVSNMNRTIVRYMDQTHVDTFDVVCWTIWR